MKPLTRAREADKHYNIKGEIMEKETPSYDEFEAMRSKLAEKTAQVKILQETIFKMATMAGAARDRLPVESEVAADPPPKMTIKQSVALQCILEGQPNKRLQEILGTTLSTAKVHVRGVMTKMGASTRSDVCLMAVEWYRVVSDEDYLALAGVPKGWVREVDPDGGDHDKYLAAVRA